MMNKIKKNHSSKWICVTLYYVIITIVKSLTESTILILALSILPVLVLILFTIMTNKGVLRLHNKILMKYILGIMLFCYMSAIWAENSSYAIRKGNNLLLILVLTSSIYMCIYDEEDVVSGLLSSIMWGGYIVVIYAFYRYGISYVMSMLSRGIRIYNPILNTNEIGICAAYSILICLYFLINNGVRLSNIVSLVLAIISLVMLAASGSRKALVMIIGGIILLFILKNFDNKRIVNSFIKILGTILLLIIVGFVFSRTSLFEGTFGRIETMINGFLGSGIIDNSTLVRLRMIEIGKELFKNNPILGIGMDNAQIYAGAEFNRTNFYLHNNYIEMLADGGLVGFIIYYWIYVYILIHMWKMRDFHKNDYTITLIFLLIYLVMDYGMVTYETKTTYVFLMLFIFELDRIKIKRTRSKQLKTEILELQRS